MESLVHLPYLTIGSKVEFSSKEEGYKGSYFTATIIDTPQPTTNNNNTYVIQYDNITNEEGTKPELAHVSCIRPLPPQPLVEDKEQHSSCSFVLNDVVEAFYNDGWWVGVVDKVKRNGGVGGGGGEMKRYRVRFEDPLHFIEFDENLLRPHFDWVDGKWVSFDSSTKFEPESESITDTASAGKTVTDTASASAGKEPKVNITAEAFKFQDTENTILRSDDTVMMRVSTNEGPELESITFEASQRESDNGEKIVRDSASTENESGLGITPLSYQFQNTKTVMMGASTEDGPESESIIVETSPCELDNGEKNVVDSATENEVELDAPESESITVEASPCELDNGEKNILDSATENEAELDAPESESITVEASPCEFDNGEKNVLDSATENKAELDTSPMAFQIQNTENTVEQTVEVSSPHTSNIPHSGQVGNGDKDIVPLEASQCELDNCDMTLLDSAAIVNESGLGQVRNGDGGSNEDQIVITFASIKEGPESESESITVGASQCEFDHGDKTAMATKNELEFDIIAGALQFQDWEITFDDAVDVLSECTTIIPNSGQVRNGDGGSNGDETVLTFASTEEGLELESVTLDASRSESTFVESGLQELTAKETVENSSTSDREKDTRITIMELTAGTKTTSEVVLPFVKNLIIWETLESFEVYKKMPQKPHFRPLYEEVELLREGLAIGRVVTFINIVDIIGKLRFDDSNSPAISTLIEDILKVLPEFDEHGFDTEPLKNHLGKLVSARSNVAQLEVEAKETKSQLMEKSCDKIRIKEKSNVVVKELVKIVKKLKDLEDQKVNNTSQIVKLTSSLDSITGSLEAAHQELHKLAGGF